MSTPFHITSTTLAVGKTPDRRAVWRNGEGPTFISIHDAKGKQHFIEVDESHYERIPKPYTYGSLGLGNRKS